MSRGFVYGCSRLVGWRGALALRIPGGRRCVAWFRACCVREARSRLSPRILVAAFAVQELGHVQLQSSRATGTAPSGNLRITTEPRATISEFGACPTSYVEASSEPLGWLCRR